MKTRTPILIGAALGALALVATASPASAEDCGSSHSYDQGYSQNVDYSYRNVNRTYTYNNTRRVVDSREIRRKTKRILRRMMRNLDQNDDGYISRYEARWSDNLRFKFRRIDRNRDGFIGRWELRQHLKKVVRRSLRRQARQQQTYYY